MIKNNKKWNDKDKKGLPDFIKKEICRRRKEKDSCRRRKEKESCRWRRK